MSTCPRCVILEKQNAVLEKRIADLETRLRVAEMSSYEQAVEFDRLARGGMSGAAIAERVGRHKGYVNNLLRAFAKLEPGIMAAWKRGDAGTKTDRLVKLAAKSHAEQRVEWKKQATRESGKRLTR